MHRLCLYRIIAACCCLVVAASPLRADSQIETDGSLGAGVVIGEGLPGIYTISEGLGTRPGGGANLFHSFLTFDLGFGDTALFTATQPTDNVISRVTGGVPSSIFGTISSAIPGANFYFINQAGFMFGEGATIDTSGSFHVTTADVLGFPGGGTFAAMPMVGETLSADAPVSFGFLSQAPASIVVDGASLLPEPTIPRNQTISLIGGDLSLLNGASITSPGARVNLVSVGGPGTVIADSLANGALPNGVDDAMNVDSFSSLGRIEIQNSTVSVTGLFGGVTPPGTIVVRGGNVVLDGGRLDAYGEGAAALGVDLKARDALEMIDGAIRTGTGDLRIDASSMSMVDSVAWSDAQRQFSLGDPQNGDVTIRVDGALEMTRSSVSSFVDEFQFSGAGQVSLHANSISMNESLVEVETRDLGGGIELVAETLQMNDSAIRSRGFDSAAQIGDVEIRAADSVLIGGNSEITSSTRADGNAANIIIETADLSIDSSRVSASGSSFGASGSITFDADTVAVANGSTVEVTQASPTIDVAIGITARDSLTVTGGSEISSLNSGNQGLDGGRIEIVSSDVTIDDSTVNVSNDLVELEQGSGDIVFEVDTLTVTGGGSILSNNNARGLGGSVRIQATESVDVAGAGSRIASESLGGGPAGSILIDADSIRLSDGAQISTSVVGSYGGLFFQPAGPIELTADEISLVDAAIRSENLGNSGNAGDITVDAGALRIERSSISTRSVGGLGGNINVENDGVTYFLDSSVTTSVSSGVGSGGNIFLTAPQIALNRTEIRANADAGNGGNITITTDAFVTSPDSVIDASANTGIDGSILVNAPEVNVESGLAQLASDFLGASDLIQPSCAARLNDAEQQSSFVVSSRRGLPSSPEGMLMAFDALGDSGGNLSQSAGAMVADARFGAAAASQTAATEALRGGRPEFAESEFAAAAAKYEKLGADANQFVALRGLAQSQQSLGRFAASVETLQRAVEVAGATEDQAGMASALGSLGNAYVALGRPDEAQSILKRGIGIAKDVGNPGLAATILNNLGNQQTTASSHAAAQESYAEAAQLAQNAGDSAAAATAYSNAARAAAANGQPAAAFELLRKASQATGALTSSANRVHLWIHQANSWNQIGEHAPNRVSETRGKAYGLLTGAAQEADSLKADRALSYALGGLGDLYRDETRLDEALYLTRLAQQAAERGDAIDSTYRWYWQAGQILWAQQNSEDAIASYRRAVELLEETRRETQGVYGDLSAHFRRAVAPVYLDLVDALLASSDESGAQAAIETTLREARGTVELLKAAELRDYFRDDCIAEIEAKTESLDAIASDAAIVYPILLPNRLDLLVTLPEGIKRYTVPVGAKRIAESSREFRRTLQKLTSNEYLPISENLYDWLVRPYAEELSRQHVNTIVFVPDGPLRTIPMAALNDGEKFLVQQYALAVTPSLAMVDPQPLEREGMSLLLAGISDSVGGFAPLAMVPKEMEALQTLRGGEVLLNDEFQLDRVEQEILETQPNVVHLASHAVFSGDPETSYVLTHDGRLTMDRLSAVVGTTQFRDRPLELLVLSACETAAGDDRSGLGLAGVAINAGARSAVGSLWSIADEATYRLMVSFYGALGEPGTSKAEALRQAQIVIHADDRYKHPFFWSPFLMINNWQ